MPPMIVIGGQMRLNKVSAELDTLIAHTPRGWEVRHLQNTSRPVRTV